MDGQSPDPRAEALASYFRERAAAFSMSADATNEQHVAAAGMALLDAAQLAERLPATDARLRKLSLAGRFETVGHGASVFVETPDLRAVIQRPLSGTPMSGEEVLGLVVATACGE